MAEKTNLLSAVIVDDEKHCLETLSWQLQRFCPEVNLLATCSGAQEALEILQKQSVDLVFLDIEMPHMNGFEMLQQLSSIKFDVIFTTAYDMFAVKAFQFSAVDYLLKPIDKDQLQQAVQKVLLKGQAISAEQLNVLFQSLYQQAPNMQKIALPTMEGLEFIQSNQIVHCQSESNYTHIFLQNGSKLLISKTLKETEEMLTGHNFMRVHHSHLINLNHIKKYVKGDGGYVIMSNDDSINVSRSRKEDLLKAF
ncbi:MAG: LytR/AlgR family response regulator transcription factor [Cyclobacteriaceae bacterium]